MLCSEIKKGLISLIIDRFSSQNHHWKAENLNFHSLVSDLTLLSRPAPLLGSVQQVQRLLKGNSWQRGEGGGVQGPLHTF